MNFKHKKGIIVICCLFLVTILVLVLNMESIENQMSGVLAQNETIINQDSNHKTLEFSIISPDEFRYAISYAINFNPTPNRQVISIKNADNGSENYIFTGSKLGFPEWLGNNYVFFTSFCGTNCQGLYLINVLTKETRQAILTYMGGEDGKPQYTVFHDWFGKTFKFQGTPNEITSDNDNYSRPLLVLKMSDGNGNILGEQELSFDENNLQLSE